MQTGDLIITLFLVTAGGFLAFAAWSMYNTRQAKRQRRDGSADGRDVRAARPNTGGD